MTKRIYIIEDEEVVRLSMMEIIDKLQDDIEVIGYSGNGEEGLKECLELKPDLAFVDIMLPDINGLEVLSVIKKKSPEIKVIIHSGYLILNIAKLSYDEKADGIIEKPASVHEIKTAINAVLSGDVYYSKNIMDKLNSC